MAHFDKVLKQGGRSASGRLAMLEDEVLMGSFENTSWLDYSKNPTQYAHGTTTVSSHSVYWNDASMSAIVKFDLADVQTFVPHSNIFRRTPRIDVHFRQSPTQEEPTVRIGFHNLDAKECKEVIDRAMANKAWMEPKHKISSHVEEDFVQRNAGVGGIFIRQQRQQEQTKALANEAFTDMEALLERARTLVQLIERYSDELGKKAQSGSVDDENREFLSVLNNIGIKNPATKKTCGSRYHEELSRELSDYLLGNLSRHNKMGMITLPDLYCIVNRARGTELISPNDLYQACVLFETLGLPFRLRSFETGALVVQSKDHSDEMIIKRLTELLKENGTLTSSLVAQELGVSLALSWEHLRTAESQGRLCRDETIQETTFYPNRYAEYNISDS